MFTFYKFFHIYVYKQPFKLRFLCARLFIFVIIWPMHLYFTTNSFHNECKSMVFFLIRYGKQDLAVYQTQYIRHSSMSKTTSNSQPCKASLFISRAA